MVRQFRLLLWKMVRKFLFRLDAESAHHLSLRLLKLGIVLGGVPLRIASGTSLEYRKNRSIGRFPRVFGMEFRSRLGLAAGFDKNAEILAGLPSLGFGFAEIGTVTPRPQSGNSKPRLFRDPAREALFNRMGFNNLG